MASSSSPSSFVSGFNSLAAADPPATLPVDSDLVVILAALLCSLICCVGLFAAVRCACLQRAANVNTSRSMPKVPSDKGLKRKVLESLPKSTFTNNNNNNNNNSCSGSTSSSTSSGSTVVIDDGNLVECVICLTEFVEGDVLRILPHCGHGFHVGCIDTWLGSHSSCPSCRQNLGVSRCNKCGELPAANSTGDIDLEIGGFKAATATATATATTTTNQDDDDNRFLA